MFLTLFTVLVFSGVPHLSAIYLVLSLICFIKETQLGSKYEPIRLFCESV